MGAGSVFWISVEEPRAARAARVDENGATTIETTDEELLDRIAGRDPRALAELVQRHGGWATRFVERLTGSRDTAEEVVQSAFLRVWEGSGRWERRSRFSTWFYRVLHNLGIDQLRRRRAVVEALDESLVDGAPTPEQSIESRDRAERVRRALDALPERQRAAIVLSHYEECSQAEAAAILGISEGALESLLSRGRAALRKRLGSELN
jgi:RNA polymerase sigma-70 factor (ECF subfamily)